MRNHGIFKVYLLNISCNLLMRNRLGKFFHKQNSHMSRVMRKPAICIGPDQLRGNPDQLRGNHAADQRLCFCYKTVQSLSFLNTKFQASSQLLWLYSLVCVGPSPKPQNRFSRSACPFTKTLIRRYRGLRQHC